MLFERDNEMAPYRPLKGFFAVFAAFALGVLIAASAQAGQDPAPVAPIEQHHAALIEAMKNAESLGYQGRYEKLTPAIKSAFDLDYMARIAASRYWDKADDSQKKDMVAAFTEMTIANYAARFDGYNGEKFETLSSEEVQRGDILVKTRLVKSDGEEIGFNYLMRKNGQDWRIVDIFLKGSYSELATKRSEYASFLKEGGVERLTSALREKALSVAQKADQ